MKSMTGFGKSQITEEGITVAVELKSVNNRFLDISIKLPRSINFLEQQVKKLLQKYFTRGRIDVFISLSAGEEQFKNITINNVLAEKIYMAGKQLSEKLNIQNDLSICALLKMPEVLAVENGEQDEDLLKRLVLSQVDEAATKLDAARVAEGLALENDIAMRVDTILSFTQQLKSFEVSVISEYREKLQQRIAEALQGVEIDQSKLINEVAFFTDKSNIDEELTRLSSHIEQLRKAMKANDSVGRNLDFIIQEFNREANTICSKANNSDVTKIGVNLKCEIEKIREQVQNIE